MPPLTNKLYAKINIDFIKLSALSMSSIQFIDISSTHASNSCFIRANSSFVIDPSPSLNLVSLSLDASKSGRVGAGGI